jgi:hypothetical protein
VDPAPLLTEFLDQQTAQQDAEPQPDAPGHPPILGVAACLLAGLALLSAALQGSTFLTRPLAAVGLLLGFIGVAVVGSGKPLRLVLPIGGAVLSGAVLVVALFVPALLGPRYDVSREKSDYDPAAVRVVPLHLSGGTDALEIDGYADAARAALQQGTIRVRIGRATVAPVQVVDSRKRFTKQPYLAVTVQIQNLGTPARVRLVHWGTTGERAVPEAVATAGGVKLAPANLNPDVPVGLSYGQELFPGKSASDLLVFEAPTLGAPVRLELAAEAWGGSGVFRFQIPGTMLLPLQGKNNRP